jgi:hypothetical protein
MREASKLNVNPAILCNTYWSIYSISYKERNSIMCSIFMQKMKYECNLQLTLELIKTF